MLAEVFPNKRIVATLSRQLIWSHFALLHPIEAPLARAFFRRMQNIEVVAPLEIVSAHFTGLNAR